MWVSSKVAICRLVLEPTSTASRPSGVLNGEMSLRYVTAKPSLSEILLSTRVVKKFSLMTCWPANVNIPISPLVPGLMPLLGIDQKGRYLWTEGSTPPGIGAGVHAGEVSGAEQRVPLRAATEGTVSKLVMPRDWRIPSSSPKTNNLSFRIAPPACAPN